MAGASFVEQRFGARENGATLMIVTNLYSHSSSGVVCGGVMSRSVVELRQPEASVFGDSAQDITI